MQYFELLQNQNWKAALGKKWFQVQFGWGLLYVVLILCCAPLIFTTIQSRKGEVFNDPLIQWFTPIDVSWPTFVVIYLAVVLGIISLYKQPYSINRLLLAYSFVTTARIWSVYLSNFDPPTDTIPLEDPFLKLFIYDNTQVTKDLFFSGHTCTMALLWLTAIRPLMKNLFLMGTIATALLVVIQHVHYSIDVIAAIPFTWISVYLADLIQKKASKTH